MVVLRVGNTRIGVKINLSDVYTDEFMNVYLYFSHLYVGGFYGSYFYDRKNEYIYAST